MATISTEELCRILAGEGNQPLTRPRITQLEKDGMPKAGRDQWDPVRCMYWYIGVLRRSVKSRQTENEDGSRSSTEQERKRLLRAQADKAEIDLAKTRGDCLSIIDHERVLSDLIQETRARIRAVAPRVAGDLVNESSRTMIQAKLEKAHDEALVKLSQVVPRTPSELDQHDTTPPAGKDPAPKKAKKASPKKAKAKPRAGR